MVVCFFSDQFLKYFFDLGRSTGILQEGLILGFFRGVHFPGMTIFFCSISGCQVLLLSFYKSHIMLWKILNLQGFVLCRLVIGRIYWLYPFGRMTSNKAKRMLILQFFILMRRKEEGLHFHDAVAEMPCHLYCSIRYLLSAFIILQILLSGLLFTLPSVPKTAAICNVSKLSGNEWSIDPFVNILSQISFRVLCLIKLSNFNRLWKPPL